MTFNGQLSEGQLEAIRKSSRVRRELAFGSHLFFFSIYLPHYIKYPFAPMHFKMFEITESPDIRFFTLTSFRDSAKSTINTLSLPIWAVVGKLQKKFVVIVSQTQSQAKYHLLNIRRELEGNDLLKNDIGPFHEEEDEWGSTTIVISNYDARITIASTEQSIRGIRHGAHRPDLIICDDVEDLNSVKTKEGRDKTWNWFTGEVLPLGSKETKYIVVGNLLHEDSLIMRLKKVIAEGKLDAKYFAFPLLDENNNIAWPGKFPNMADIDKLRGQIPSDIAWFREYLLKIISDEDRVIHPEWIHFSDPPSLASEDYRFSVVSVDLAISDRKSADYTAMVAAHVFGYGEKMIIYIHSYLINKRMDSPTAMETAISYSKSLGTGIHPRVFIEDVGYQRSFAQQLRTKNIAAEEVQIHGQDKRSRLALIAPLIQQGRILFAKNGNEELISQITGFGVEKHDDMADALSLLVLRVLEIDQDEPEPTLTIISTGGIFNERMLGEPYHEPISMDSIF